MDISKLDKAEVLAALYNNSKPLGLGILHFDQQTMTTAEAAELLKTQTSFDYLKGRVMKINLSGDQLITGLYNRDNGEGAAERVLTQLSSRVTKSPAGTMTKQEAIEAMERGEKVTHNYFCRGEWMTITDDMITFEDGIRCSIDDFFSDRTGEGWESGYSIFGG